MLRKLIVPLAVVGGCLSFALVARADDPKDLTRVEVRDITLFVPEGWKQTELTADQQRFRAAQFEIPAAEGDKAGTELVVFYFGPQGGGDAAANVERWLGQFEGQGRKHKQVQGESTQGSYILVDISGTYNKPVGPPVQRKFEAMPDARMIGVILNKGDAGNYFLKLAGPAKTVEGAAAALRTAIGAKADAEQPVEQ